MTANNKSRRPIALLAAVLSVLMLVSLTVVPVFAEDATVAVTEPSTEEQATAAESPAESGAESSAETTVGTSAGTEAQTSASTEATTGAADSDDDKDSGDITGAIINLVVGGVILIAAAVLCIVFRKKIPGWWKALKSECGKIVWCPKDKLKKNSLVVIVIIVALAIVIALLDFTFSRGIMILRDLIAK